MFLFVTGMYATPRKIQLKEIWTGETTKKCHKNWLYVKKD